MGFFLLGSDVRVAGQRHFSGLEALEDERIRHDRFVETLNFELKK